MANPFLVLGGVAVGVVTAGIGVLQVPGWIDSANDSAVTNDLSQVAMAQVAAYTVNAKYLPSVDALEDGIAAGYADSGIRMQRSAGVKMHVATSTAFTSWAAVGLSKSGHVLVRTSDSSTIYSSADIDFTGIEGVDAKASSQAEYTSILMEMMAAGLTLPAGISASALNSFATGLG